MRLSGHQALVETRRILDDPVDYVAGEPPIEHRQFQDDEIEAWLNHAMDDLHNTVDQHNNSYYLEEQAVVYPATTQFITVQGRGNDRRLREFRRIKYVLDATNTAGLTAGDQPVGVQRFTPGTEIHPATFAEMRRHYSYGRVSGWTWRRPRFAFEGNRLYIAPAPSTQRTIIIAYVPAPDFVDREGEALIEDLPDGYHYLLPLRAALFATSRLREMASTERIRARYDEGLASMLGHLKRRQTQRPRLVKVLTGRY